MRVLDTPIRLALCAAAAGLLSAAAATSAAGDTAVTWHDVSEIDATTDEAPGAYLGQWYHSQYDTGDLSLDADSTELIHHDGAARLRLPNGGYVSLDQEDGPDNSSGHQIETRFADFTGSYALRVVAGPPAAYHLVVSGCPPTDPYRPVTLTYAGPFPDGTGWHTIDVSHGDQALWTSSKPVGDLDTSTPHTLADYKAQCPGGVINNHGFELSQTKGADSLVDDVVFLHDATNFQSNPPAGVTVVGTASNDVLQGFHGYDRVWGMAGDDTLNGRDGNDRLYGGDGNDVILGEPGADMLSGGRGGDDLYGNLGPDTLRPGPDNDLVFGGKGNDHVLLKNDHRPDRISCGTGRDTVTYAHRRDRLDRLTGCEHVEPH